jgi:hypothetical protein
LGANPGACDVKGGAGYHLPMSSATHRDAGSEIDGQDLSNNEILFLRAELFWEIESLIHPCFTGSYAKQPLCLSERLRLKIAKREQPSSETVASK